MEMGDPRRPSPRPSTNIYPSSGSGATPLFTEVLRPLIRENGPLAFEDFMDLALYHPEHGYYSEPSRRRTGHTGDFATNVSVGETFGRLLALRLHEFWQAHDAPRSLHVFELGPEDGSLANDILKEARRLSAAFHAAVHYRACEHSARKRETLHARLATFGEPNLSVSASPPDSPGGPGVILANEVLDALPVKLLRFRKGAWHHRTVSLHEGRLAWHDLPANDPELPSLLGTHYPDGYQTELCTRYPSFLRDLAALLDRGLFIFLDYGFLHDDYYHPDRTEGTLQTYAQHQAGADPLAAPGEQDLSAHVNFTAVVAAARLAGLIPLGFARQESYLTALAKPILLNLPAGSASTSFLRQFRTLTHPGFFGSKFHVLELAKGELAPGFSFPCASSAPGGQA